MNLTRIFTERVSGRTMILPRSRLQATGGRLKVSWPTAGWLFYVYLCGTFRIAYGLRRSRRRILTALNGSARLPDFVGDGFRLCAGWTPEDGYYLRARDEVGSLFLARVFGRGDSAY